MAIKNPEALSIESQQLLLKITRTAIEAYLMGHTRPTFQISDAALLEERGAFVSLHKAGKLRGCIGYVISDKPLYQTVAEAGVAAATRDPRFKPLEIKEIPEIEIEISVLTPFERLQNTDEIEVGVHGLYIIYGRQSGLLLPQVATNYGLDRTQFLEQTCRKAGLPGHAWQWPRIEIYIFSAQVFNETVCNAQ